MTEPEKSTQPITPTNPSEVNARLERETSRTSEKMTVNPIEIVILGSITLLLGQGILNLFDTRTSGPTAVGQTGEEKATGRTGRFPASRGMDGQAASPKLAQLDVRCDTGKLETGSSRVRLSGPLCGIAEGTSTTEPRRIVKSQILNQANRYQAAVFSDAETGKFTTDYIPLVTGTNTFKMEFIYASGKHSTQELVILKN